MTCGIYIIKNKINNKVYVGSSNNTDRRWRCHYKLLVSGNHFNEHLQSAWNLHGENDFDFEVVEILSENENLLIEKEQFWMDFHNSYHRDYGYNICPKADRTIVSEETRKKQSERLKGIAPLPAGWHHSEDTKKQISQSTIGKKKKPHAEETKEKIGRRCRGKKYEELYGDAKAAALRADKSRTYEERFGLSKAVELKKSKQKTLEERHGFEKAIEIKDKMSKNRIGKSFISVAGKESLRQSKLGVNNPMYVEVDSNVVVSLTIAFEGVITKSMVEKFGLSRYKIKQILIEQGVWNDNKTDNCDPS